MNYQTIKLNPHFTSLSASNLEKLKNVLKFVEENQINDSEIVDLLKLVFKGFNFPIPEKKDTVNPWDPNYPLPMAPYIIPFDPPNNVPWNPVIWCCENMNKNKHD